MEVKILENNQYVELQNKLTQKYSPLFGFLQSYQWSVFKKALGNSVIRIGAFKNHDLVAFGQFTSSRKWFWPKTCSLEAHRGPIVPESFFVDKIDGKYLSQIFLSKVSKLAKRKKTCIGDYLNFNQISKKIVIEPCFVENKDSEVFKQISSQGYKYLEHSISPKETAFLNLQENIDDLKTKMHHKTRYNINLSCRKGLELIESREKWGIKKFLELQKETARRNEFTEFKDSYYKTLLKSTNTSFSKLFLVRDKESGEILSAGIWIFFGRTCTYLFGASSNILRNKMPAFFMHYKVIEYAQKHGFWFYDFFGIDTTTTKKGWEGITRFKKGFGGKEVRLIGRFEYSD